MKHFKGTPIGLAQTLPSNSKFWLERVSEDKPSSLSGLVVSDEGKKFYNNDTRLPHVAVVAMATNKTDQMSCLHHGKMYAFSEKKNSDIIVPQ